MYESRSIGVVIPAYNEELSVGGVVRDLRALRNCDDSPLIEDIVVCDNGSEDRTGAVARQAGARVAYEARRGYGNACAAGAKALYPVQIVLFVDADRSVHAGEARALLGEIIDGADIVIGSRTLGHVEPGAMTLPQRLGNRLATWLIRRLWKHPATDLGPFRAVKRDCLSALYMTSETYGWTVEMQIKAVQQGLDSREVPVTCRKRVGDSKISGTFIGAASAGIGIIATILVLYARGQRNGGIGVSPSC